MPGKLLDRILFTCKHEFSWPRRDERGDYYQVCLHCGVQYRYDWARMRRLEKMDVVAAPTPLPPAGRRPMHKHDTRTTWHPRERRLKWNVEVEFRVDGTNEWQKGHAENISRSGLLFTTSQPVQLGGNIEVLVEMPPEIVGVTGTRVVCHGTVARVANGGEVNQIAARISGYDLMAQRAG